MKARHKISLDLNGFFSPMLEGGLEQPVTRHEDLFKTAHQAIKAFKSTGHLPFSKLPSDEILRDNVLLEARRYKDVKNIVVFGIGGSALGTSSIYHAIKGPLAHLKQDGDPKLFVIDNIDSDWMHDLFGVIDPEETVFVIISKSGNTSETLAQYLALKHRFPNLESKHIFLITDANQGYLKDLRDQEDHRGLAIPHGVGGRFSVFTAVGLFPLAIAGIDITELLAGAAHMEEACQSDVLMQNPAGLLAVTLHEWLSEKGLNQVVMMPYSERLRYFSDWFAQLWGESLGKKDNVKGEEIFTGSTPIKSVGVTDQHSQLQLYLHGPKDKVFLFVDVDEPEHEVTLGEAALKDERVDFLTGQTLHELLANEKRATEQCLLEQNRPNASLSITEVNAYQLGQLYQLFMNVIPYMGAFLEINAFDQPAVERIKKFTFGLMGRSGFEDYSEKLKHQVKDDSFRF